MAKLTYRDSSNNQIAAYLFEYDSLGRLIRSVEHGADNTITQRTEHLYDTYNRLKEQTWVIQGDSFSESYLYNDPPVGADDSVRPQDGSLKQMTTATGDTIHYNYDGLKRLESTAIKNSSGTTLFRTGYAYKAGAQADLTSTRIGVYTTWNPDYTIINSNSYVYDAVGNITQVKDAKNGNRLLAEYTYDVQNQLTQEIIYTYTGTSTTPATTTTYTYTYDTAGNIQTESKNGVLTKSYAYEDTAWKDLLTKFNDTEFEYDAIGNPISYENVKNEYHFSWVNGRRLSQATVDGSESYYIGYDYDLDGIRTKKTATVDSTGVTTTHNYITQNGKVVRETITNGTTTREFDFIYDESGRPFAVKYTINGTTSAMFYYILNLQGDVVKIIAENGTVMANYSYNAWGEVLSVTNASGAAITAPGHLANLNPIRYRGYYYDTETGFYYLQSRYYDPSTHRFINSDSITSTGQGVVGTNMFAYCLNCPPVCADSEGTDAIIVTNVDIAGHMGILVEDENGDWYHFYWGASNGDGSSGSSASISPCGTGARTWCKKYDGDLDLDSINASGQYGSSYDSIIYLKGDFSSCLNEMRNPTGEYNLYSNNCAQKSLSILAQADTEYSDILEDATGYWHPTRAHSKVEYGICARETRKKISRWLNKAVDFFASLF